MPYQNLIFIWTAPLFVYPLCRGQHGLREGSVREGACRRLAPSKGSRRVDPRRPHSRRVLRRSRRVKGILDEDDIAGADHVLSEGLYH